MKNVDFALFVIYNGRYHSSLYSGAVVAFRKKGVYVSKDIFSLISDESTRSAADIPFSDEPHAFVETVDYFIPTKEPLKRQMSRIVITVGGEEKISIEANSSIILDELCTRINDAVKYKKQGYLRRTRFMTGAPLFYLHIVIFESEKKVKNTNKFRYQIFLNKFMGFFY